MARQARPRPYDSRLSVASGARSAGQQSGTGDLPAGASGEGWVLPVDARQAHGRDAHATCATVNREMRPYAGVFEERGLLLRNDCPKCGPSVLGQ